MNSQRELATKWDPDEAFAGLRPAGFARLNRKLDGLLVLNVVILIGMAKLVFFPS